MPVNFAEKPSYTIDDLLTIMRLLRGEDGCPWDAKQDHHSIRKNFLEETCEALEAIDNEDVTLLREELGDVLFQVVFHAQLEAEAGQFTFDEVCDSICKKLIVRHPHVFGQAQAADGTQALANWETIKQHTKGQTTTAQTLESVPMTLPALMRSEKVQSRAAKAGFDYPDRDWTMRVLEGELDELRQAIRQNDQTAIDEELGDLLFSAVNVARFVGSDPEYALTRACDKFIRRFTRVEQLAQEGEVDMTAASIEELDRLWALAKKDLDVLSQADLSEDI